MEVNTNHKKNKQHKKQLETNGKVDKFDKKAYRKRKYCNQSKLMQWETQRRKQLLRELDQDGTVSIQNKFRFRNQSAVVNDDKQIKFKKSMRAAAKREEKISVYSERCKRKEEREEALQKYREKRTEMYKKLSRKTKKGQPVMKNRLELLLQKIQLSQ